MGTRIVVWKRDNATGVETILDVTEWKATSEMTPAEKRKFTQYKNFQLDFIARLPNGPHRLLLEVVKFPDAMLTES